MNPEQSIVHISREIRQALDRLANNTSNAAVTGDKASHDYYLGYVEAANRVVQGLVIVLDAYEVFPEAVDQFLLATVEEIAKQSDISHHRVTVAVFQHDATIEQYHYGKQAAYDHALGLIRDAFPDVYEAGSKETLK